MDKPYAVIIEDDPTLGDIFVTVMQQAGFDTNLDADGNRYMAFLEKRCPELIILDMHLPFAAGREILADLRTRGLCQSTKILVATADLHMADEMQGKVDFVLIKPVRVNRLLEIASSVRGN